MRLRRINDWTLEDRLAAGDRPLVVMFVRSGMRSVEAPERELARLADAYSEAEFFLIDLAEHPSLAERHQISTVPTTLIFVRGVEATRHLGRSLEQPVGRILGPKPGPSEG